MAVHPHTVQYECWIVPVLVQQKVLNVQLVLWVAHICCITMLEKKPEVKHEQKLCVSSLEAQVIGHRPSQFKGQEKVSSRAAHNLLN